MPSGTKPFNDLSSGFRRSVERHPERPALEVSGRPLSYGSLWDRASSIAATLQAGQSHPSHTLTALLAHRSATAMSGIQGILLSGHGYVPLNPNFPLERTAAMLQRSGAASLVAGSEALDALAGLLPLCRTPMRVLLPDLEDARELGERFPRHSFVTRNMFAPASRLRRQTASPDDIAYLLFTSGSTGQPKGVAVTHANIRHFIDVVSNRYGFRPSDRFSQIFELVFDLSLFDLFVAWEHGACVCCPAKDDALLPARFIRESAVSVWFSVPSLALHMKQMRLLRDSAFPDLRLSLFCGEALLAETAQAWQIAAPNSRIENLYGPTEVTLACTAYAWDSESSPKVCERGVVPIGRPFPGLRTSIVNEQREEVRPGEPGELLVAGPQVAPGYWNDEARTREAFVVPPGKDEIHYCTGDLVRRRDANAPIQYLGRLDHQIKIRGNRVELGEIEAALREAAGVENAIAVGWPSTESGADGVAAFLQGETGDVDEAALQEKLAQRLPPYMIPGRFVVVSEMPLNANGKIDRNELARSLEEGSLQVAGAKDRVPERAAANERGIVILGCPRSGTTLVRRILDSHPGIACPGETCLFTACARFLHADVVSDGLEFGVVNGLAFAGISPEETMSRLRELAFGFHRELAHRQNKRRWAEKTAVDVFHLPQIEALCGDDVQYVCVIRHGLDVACSIREFSERGQAYLSELHAYIRRYPRPLEAFAHAWVDATRSMLELAQRRPGQTLLLRYEDLVEGQEREVSRLFEFLGESAHRHDGTLAAASSGQLGLGDWKAYSRKSFDSGSIHRWRSLPPGMTSRLGEICNDVLLECGYEAVPLQRDPGQAAARRRYTMALKLGGRSSGTAAGE